MAASHLYLKAEQWTHTTQETSHNQVNVQGMLLPQIPVPELQTSPYLARVWVCEPVCTHPYK